VFELHKTDSSKIPVAILGVTGIVGQTFSWLLSNHPWFEPVLFIASEKRQGLQFDHSARWLLPVEMPQLLQKKRLSCLDIQTLKKNDVKIVFSALPGNIANSIESDLREHGFYVFSNAGAHRQDNNVPILIPEVNPTSLSLIKKQNFPEQGSIICNSNCAVSGLALALKSLTEYGIRSLAISTYQSISGAGYPGIAALDINQNVIPFIENEEEKIANEINKIFDAEIDISATCVRVPTLFGHLIVVWACFDMPFTKKKIIHSWKNFKSIQSGLPSIPENPLVYGNCPGFPQPVLTFQGSSSGMQVHIGRLTLIKNGIRFILLVNNLVRGAAGGSIANAELFVSKYCDKL
jgi:aspartate-semialdehyde dehydrogenase